MLKDPKRQFLMDVDGLPRLCCVLRVLCVCSCMASVFVCMNVSVCNGSQITQQASRVMSEEANILIPLGHGRSVTT